MVHLEMGLNQKLLKLLCLQPSAHGCAPTYTYKITGGKRVMPLGGMHFGIKVCQS